MNVLRETLIPHLTCPSTVPTFTVIILAHIDAGKTTLCDTLIHSLHPGVISPRESALNTACGGGKDRYIRWLDWGEEERRRGITINGSGITVVFKDLFNLTSAKLPPPPPQQQLQAGNTSLIQLLDSPGHLDFSSEVLALSHSLTSPGCIILLDAVKGIEVRTVQLIRLGVQRGSTPVVVINKVDLLYDIIATSDSTNPTQRGADLAQAWFRLRGLVEELNAVTATVVNSYLRESEVTETEKAKLENVWNFDPRQNVIYGSASQLWGVRVRDVTRYWSSRINKFSGGEKKISPKQLRTLIWSDSCINPKTMKVSRYNSSKESYFSMDGDGEAEGGIGEIVNVPIFAALVLGPVWGVYDLINGSRKGPKEDKIATLKRWNVPGFSIDNDDGDDYSDLEAPKYKGEIDGRIQAVMRRFYPIAQAVLSAVTDTVPKENTAEVLPEKNDDNELSPPVRAIVPKYVTVAKENVIGLVEDSEESAITMGFLKVLEGRVKEGDRLYVLPSSDGDTVGDEKNHDDDSVNHDVYKPSLTDPVKIFMICGSSLTSIKSLGPGKIGAVYCPNIESLCPKSSFTLSKKPDSSLAIDLDKGARRMDPILKVSVEAEGGVSERKVLEHGLRKLGNCDQSVSVEITEKGEFLLGAIGEVHLENTVNNLKETYCGGKIGIKIGEAVISYGETCLAGGGSGEEGWTNKEQTPLGQLSNPIFKRDLALLCEDNTQPNYGYGSRNGRCRFRFDQGTITLSVCSSKDALEGEHGEYIAQISSTQCSLLQAKSIQQGKCSSIKQEIIAGFYLAVKSGPLMEEPMHSVTVLLEKVEFEDEEGTADDSATGGVKPSDFSGRLITQVKNAVRNAFLTLPVRIVEVSE